MLKKEKKALIKKLGVRLIFDKNTNCLNYTMSLTHDGYGRMSFKNIQFLSHRMA